MAAIGQWNTLRVTRETAHGYYLDGGDYGEILLPNRYVPSDAAKDDVLKVFIYRDSEDRPVATTEAPLATIGQFAALRVVSVDPQIGAFLDWGIPKDLLLPYREQATPVKEGEQAVVYIDLDRKTDRIYATTRIERHLSAGPPTYAPGQRVDVLIARKTPLGYLALIEQAHIGLLYHSNLGAPLAIGQKMCAYIGGVRPDGKIDLRPDPSGYQRIHSVTEQILDALKANSGRLDLDDNSPPEAIRATFGCSKKAFKQALGALFKKRAIEFAHPGIRLAGPRPRR